MDPRTTIPLTKNKKDLKEVLQSVFFLTTHYPFKNFFADRSLGNVKKFFSSLGKYDCDFVDFCG